jgi:hypothetical protein
LATICARVDQEQLARIERVRAIHAIPLGPTSDPMNGSGGGLYELPKGVPMWPFGANEAKNLAPKMYAAAVERARTSGDTKALWVLERSVPSAGVFLGTSPSLYPAGACLAFARGAWAFEASDIDYDNVERDSGVEVYHGSASSVEWTATLSLTHYDAALRRTATEVAKCCGEHFEGELATDLPLAYDFDGDGEPEVVLHTRLLSDGTDDEGKTSVKSFHGGAITTYARVPKVDLFGSALDVDGDGRPDLRTHAGIQVAFDPKKEPCVRGRSPEPYSPAFLVHSLGDGSFSVDDDAAKSFARSWCPSTPASIHSPGDAGCARLWANTPEKLASEAERVKASCVALAATDCKAGAKAAPSAVMGCQLRAEAFAKAPPFTLP